MCTEYSFDWADKGLFGDASFKSDEDIVEQDITDLKDKAMLVLDAFLSSHKVDLNADEEDEIGLILWNAIERRGPIRD